MAGHASSLRPGHHIDLHRRVPFIAPISNCLLVGSDSGRSHSHRGLRPRPLGQRGEPSKPVRSGIHSTARSRPEALTGVPQGLAQARGLRAPKEGRLPVAGSAHRWESRHCSSVTAVAPAPRNQRERRSRRAGSAGLAGEEFRRTNIGALAREYQFDSGFVLADSGIDLNDQYRRDSLPDDRVYVLHAH